MRRFLFFSLTLLCVNAIFGQGIPLIRNYLSKEYHAHNRNFDVETDKNGIVYFANFEGLLYYDKVEWRMIHTPGVTRVTVVFRDHNGIVWAGGYNYFGRIVTKPNGEIGLKQIGNSSNFYGEVEEIWESNGELLFLVNDGSLYKCVNDRFELKKQVGKNARGIGLSEVVETETVEKGDKIVVLDDILQTVPLGNGQNAVLKRGKGIVITDENGKTLYTITENNGLCTDNVVWMEYDGHGLLWGATDDGVFSIAVPSSYSRFSKYEGLFGDVNSIAEYDGHLYVGTTRALFRLEGRSFVAVPGVDYACWDLKKSERGLLAATVNGIYCVSGATVRQLTSESSLSLLVDHSQIYSGEISGVYLIQLSDNSRKKICRMEKVTKMVKDSHGIIWFQSMYGEVWKSQPNSQAFKPYNEVAAEAIATIVLLEDSVEVVRTSEDNPFPYPLYSYIDDDGVAWLTNNEGKFLYRWKDGKPLNDMNRLLFPVNNIAVRSICKRNRELWLGRDDGLTVIDTGIEDPFLSGKPKLLFRTVRLNGDSLLWGGFGKMPESLPQLDSHDRNLAFTYSLDYCPLAGSTLYRYRLNDGNWSIWEEEQEAEFQNLPYGSYTIEIQARLSTGELSEVVSLDFSIAYPFYMRWYMILFYLMLAALLVYALFRYRMHRLNVEKHRLEAIVQERTTEVVKQKDEIEEKSKSLEKALDDLNKAQHKLIRQEKMATVGKLTQGLIDRILNPLNYINNFTKLSEGLVKDIEANIVDDKDKMDSENYEDTMDVLGMLRGNLQKVGEHGQNTTRTLKAMEEMLKDRSGGVVPMDLLPVLRQDKEMLNNYYADDIRKYGIKIEFDIPQTPIPINGNADQLSKTLMSLLGNAVYAVVKKAQREKYQPEVSLSVSIVENIANIVIRDNGIGIEPTIINKVFDPFFTTKTTGEAAGVGLYLSHEIVLSHGGTIDVKSEKNIYTEFIITLPIL